MPTNQKEKKKPSKKVGKEYEHTIQRNNTDDLYTFEKNLNLVMIRELQIKMVKYNFHPLD